MVWTKEEHELIDVLDRFLESCSKSEKLKQSNYYRLLPQIIRVTKGNVRVTEQYCQEILHTAEENTSERANDNDILSVEKKRSHNAQQLHQPNNSLDSTEKFRQPKFKVYWTILFLIGSIFTIFFAAEKSPKTTPNTFYNVAILCPASAVETARLGLRNHDKPLLEKAIADLQTIREQQGNLLDGECEQMLWKTQFVYAIDFLASQGQTKEAAINLCQISPQYFQNKAVIPWFTRWSNTNREFGQWLEQYKSERSCPVASYLEESLLN